MSIQYAGGTNVNATLTQSTGTRAELAQWIRDQLIVAGWTSSGSATDYQLTTATTPQSLVGRVRVYDPGSGNCAKLKFSNTGGTKTQAGDLFLLPAAAKVWRIIANKYQFFVFTPGNSAGREFACGGVPYLPAFLNTVITECIWGHGNANSDTDVNDTIYCFRYRNNIANQAITTLSNNFQLVNGNEWDNSAIGSQSNYANQNGCQRLVYVLGSLYHWGTSIQPGYRWHDDSQIISDPLIAWGLTGHTDEAKIRGQLWDACILSDSWPGDTTIQPDSNNPTYNFMTITNAFAGSTTVEGGGTLAVRTS
jgi:hypothetical protein